MDIFAALADPTRRTILELLVSHEHLAATEISAHFPLTPSAISQHLKVLRTAHLITMEKQAQQRIYRINPEPMAELETWVRQFTQRVEQRFQTLDALLESQKRSSV